MNKDNHINESIINDEVRAELKKNVLIIWHIYQIWKLYLAIF